MKTAASPATSGPETYETIRRRHVEYAMALVPEHVARISWPRGRIEAEQARGLRALLEHAITHSPWHRDRLRGIDLGAVTPATIDQLPTMTKADLMASWDAIVADPRVTLAGAEAHLAELRSDSYLLDEYHVIASGGSSGTCGVFLWDWRGWAIAWAGAGRSLFHVGRRVGADPPSPLASVAAFAASHASAAIAQTFSNPGLTVARFPVTLPLLEIVEGLNRTQPVLLQAYASLLPVLAAEAAAGRLRIAPKLVWSTSEPLLPEMRAAAEKAWGVPVMNGWMTSESIAASFACEAGGGFHLCDDLNVIELVDEKGEHVARGGRSARIYLTNLYNLAMPIIRYEITDQLLESESRCACGSVHTKIADVEGRLDEVFAYSGGVRVHPNTFRSPLGSEPGIVEYQVRQTTRGAEIDVVARAAVDLDRLASEIEKSLARLGVGVPAVNVHRVDAIGRRATGKLKRFVPLLP